MFNICIKIYFITPSSVSFLLARKSFPTTKPRLWLYLVRSPYELKGISSAVRMEQCVCLAIADTKWARYFWIQPRSSLQNVARMPSDCLPMYSMSDLYLSVSSVSLESSRRSYLHFCWCYDPSCCRQDAPLKLFLLHSRDVLVPMHKFPHIAPTNHTIGLTVAAALVWTPTSIITSFSHFWDQYLTRSSLKWEEFLFIHDLRGYSRWCEGQNGGR